MILLDEPINLELVADLCTVGLERPTPVPRDRSKWHVSNILESARRIARGGNGYYEGGEVKGIMSFGRIWEAAVDCYLLHFAKARGGLYVPDFEAEESGIVGSLDGMMCLPEFGGWMVSETKLRFSLNGEIPLSHLQQVRAYCHMADTDTVCYVSGHLSSTPPTAEAKLRIFRESRQAIEETWEMIANTRSYLIRTGHRPSSVA